MLFAKSHRSLFIVYILPKGRGISYWTLSWWNLMCPRFNQKRANKLLAVTSHGSGKQLGCILRFFSINHTWLSDTFSMQNVLVYIILQNGRVRHWVWTKTFSLPPYFLSGGVRLCESRIIDKREMHTNYWTNINWPLHDVHANEWIQCLTCT